MLMDNADAPMPLPLLTAALAALTVVTEGAAPRRIPLESYECAVGAAVALAGVREFRACSFVASACDGSRKLVVRFDDGPAIGAPPYVSCDAARLPHGWAPAPWPEAVAAWRAALGDRGMLTTGRRAARAVTLRLAKLAEDARAMHEAAASIYDARTAGHFGRGMGRAQAVAVGAWEAARDALNRFAAFLASPALAMDDAARAAVERAVALADPGRSRHYELRRDDGATFLRFAALDDGEALESLAFWQTTLPDVRVSLWRGEESAEGSRVEPPRQDEAELAGDRDYADFCDDHRAAWERAVEGAAHA